MPSAAGPCERPELVLNEVKVELEYKYMRLNISHNSSRRQRLPGAGL